MSGMGPEGGRVQVRHPLGGSVSSGWVPLAVPLIRRLAMGCGEPLRGRLPRWGQGSLAGPSRAGHPAGSRHG